jgi:hypothetical protein
MSKQPTPKAYLNCTSHTLSFLLPTTFRPHSEVSYKIYPKLTHLPPQQSLFTFSALMSNKDPNIYGRSHTLLMNGTKGLNPAASSYAPGSKLQNNTSSQVSLHPSPHVEARVSKLEEGHSGLREEVDSLTEKYNELCSSVDKLKKGGWPVTIGSFQEQDPDQSHQSALAFKQELDQLSREVHKSVDGVADVEKVTTMATPKANGSVPPHLRAASGASPDAGSNSLPPHLRAANGSGTGADFKSLPPHLRGKSTNG